jgi:hypothetical protein
VTDASPTDLTPSRDALAGLGRWADELDGGTLEFGAWVPSTTLANGVRTMPYVELGTDGDRFLRDVAGLGFIVPFPWQAWLAGPEGAAYREDRSRIAQATPEDIVRLMTSIIRGERFTEGELLDAYETGLLAAIARRARELAAHPG